GVGDVHHNPVHQSLATLFQQFFGQVTTGLVPPEFHELVRGLTVGEEPAVVQLLVFQVADTVNVRVTGDGRGHGEGLLDAGSANACRGPDNRVHVVNEALVFLVVDVAQGIVGDDLPQRALTHAQFIGVLH